MKKLRAVKQPEPIQTHYSLNYNNSINKFQQNRLIIPYYQTKIGIFSLHYQSFKLWNYIPIALNPNPINLSQKNFKKISLLIRKTFVRYCNLVKCEQCK